MNNDPEAFGRDMAVINQGTPCRWHDRLSRRWLIRTPLGAVICTTCDAPDPTGASPFENVSNTDV